MRAVSRLVLLDIDGTLLLSGGAGSRAMARAARELFGAAFSWEGVVPSGGLDPLLFEEAARQSGIRTGPREHRAFRERYIACLEEELARDGGAVRALPGVPEAVEMVHRRRDLVLGLLTGNYAPCAGMKLAAAGLVRSWFEVAVFGDEATTRADLVLLALERGRARFGAELDARSIVVVGDTPKDVEGARFHGATAFAVATGRYTVGELLEAGADVAVEDLSDPAPLVRLLDSPLS